MSERGMDVAAIVATEADRDALADLAAAIEAEDPDTATGEGLRAFLQRFGPLDSRGQTTLLIGVLSAQPVGFLCATVVPKLDRRRGFLYVDELYVLAEHRRRGVGTALLRAALDRARVLELSGVRLLARPGNRAAAALYTALGFAVGDSRFYELCV
ncbi:MAG: GNAT family N-acetyltransferase [Candidatus Bipolaricaulota bacterium]|nr:MAG: GNAT family N-acetyltransferase [Candidatus Bipolaricaulota bacterium]